MCGQGSRPVRVLVAEDNATGREVLRQLLNIEGIELTFVEDGAQAVDIALRHDFDLILMDLRMPVLNGYDAIRAIRATETRVGRPRTPIVVVSAATSIEDVTACTEAGADAHLAKPIRSTELLKAVLRLCLV